MELFETEGSTKSQSDSRPTILIAPADAIPALRRQPYLRAAQAFSAAEAHVALDAIRDLLPDLIVIEREFAASLAGQGMVKRIKADLKLRRCEIELVGLRRSERHRLTTPVEIILDEHPAHLLDISTSGAHVISHSSLKPKQRVRVMLQPGDSPLTAIVVWAHFELPHNGPRYRAGIEFTTSTTNVVSGFIATLMS